ncbi:hypothetical protein COV15_03100 [Candidatus Woesearchaeota archaeon CG10_big_fil_rev_8_21_14_0_10_34_12]|nr:MAG: hypothetical protein COV15_03100 [Candidatus Woesearchaeota archaeon CG10_big_fil_rev_8_21_14_0_10_34_12]
MQHSKKRCLGERTHAIRYQGTFCDDDTHLQVLRVYYFQEEVVYSSFIYHDGTLPSPEVVVWKRGEWEKQVIALEKNPNA